MDQHSDSSYIIVENEVNNKAWGNTWYTAVGYNFSSQNALDANIGRTYARYFVSGGPTVIQLNTWGVGYEQAFKKGDNLQAVKGFYEYSLFVFPPFSFTVRGEGIYELTEQSSYLRPAVGLNFIYLDLLYNYSFKLSGEQNQFGHGFTVRGKIVFPSSKWEKRRPNRC